MCAHGDVFLSVLPIRILNLKKKRIKQKLNNMDVKQLTLPSVPVVWCSAPNSSTTDKPMKFALQGIQLQGNVTEQQVLALRKLVNAAAEGRLLLPSDGDIVLLDCGIVIGSMIVQKQHQQEHNENIEETQQHEQQKEFKPVTDGCISGDVAIPLSPSSSYASSFTTTVDVINNEHYCDVNCNTNSCKVKQLLNGESVKKSDNEPPDLFEPKYSIVSEPNNLEILYDFLCCAKCMSDPTNSNCGRNRNVNRKTHEKFRSLKPKAKIELPSNVLNRNLHQLRKLPLRPPYRKVLRHNSASKKSQKLGRSFKVVAAVGIDSMPTYAIVNKLMKKKQLASGTVAMNNLNGFANNSFTNENKHHTGSNGALNLHNSVKGIDYKFKCIPKQQEPQQQQQYLSKDNEIVAIVNQCDATAINDRTYTAMSTIAAAALITSIDCNNASVDIDGKSTSSKTNDLSTNSLEQRQQNYNVSLETISAHIVTTTTTATTTTATTTKATMMTTTPTTPSNSSSRKTSFDSSCTLSSMDSGFIEMQNKLDGITVVQLPNINNERIQHHPKNTKAPPIIVTEADDKFDECGQQDSNRLNVKECLNQSRNRRKSYEEFKALFGHQHKSSSAASEKIQQPTTDIAGTIIQSVDKAKTKSRRKSYEEFKHLVRDCDSNSLTGDKTTAEINVSKCSTIYDVVQRKQSTTVSPNMVTSSSGPATNKDDVFKTNSKIYDKLLSYGTIYDIMQKKNDIYTNDYQKYDKYMTYGTIYEIMQRKSEEYDVFQRKRTLSDKIMKRGHQRVCSNGKFAGSINLGTIYDMLHRRQNSDSGVSVNSAASTIPPTAKYGSDRKYGKIYDIIQTEKSDGSPFMAADRKLRNRFSVNKVAEDVSAGHEVTVQMPNEYSEPKSPIPGAVPKKQTRMRRFSNILSYTPKVINENKSLPKSIPEDVSVPVTADAHINATGDTDGSLLSPINVKSVTGNAEKPISFDDLYSRINKLMKNEPKVLVESSKSNRCIDLVSNNDKIVQWQSDNERKMSTHQLAMLPPPSLASSKRALLKKSKSRRLSEFTRGEFLNEKS